MDPFSITAGIFSVSNGTFTLATNFWKLKNVDDDLKICLHLLLMITKDINGARRLRSRKYPQHRSQTIVTDSLLDRANSAIQDLEIATNKMMKSIEAVRVEKSVDDSISIAKRFSWVFNGKDIFIAQQWVVTAAHTRLLAVIVSMESLPDMQVETLAPPPTYEEVILRSPRQLRALKGKSTAVVVFEREESTDPVLESTPQAHADHIPPGLLSTSSHSIYEEYTEEDMVNEKILLHWQSSRRKCSTRDG